MYAIYKLGLFCYKTNVLAKRYKIMKMGFRYFRDQILKMLGIDYDYVDIGPTELVELTIHSMFMDFTFLTTEDFYIHVEFQTTDSGEDDLRRFHAYEAVLNTIDEQRTRQERYNKNSDIACKTGYQSNRRKDRSDIIYNGG